MNPAKTFNWLNVLVLAAAATASAADPDQDVAPLAIHRAAGPIAIDGDLSDQGWKGALRVDTWYETNPGDNTPPKVGNVGYLTYDDKFFYAGFEFEDPAPAAMRAPYADRDNIGNGFNDYGGIIVDAGNSGQTATFFVVTPRNIQYDAITDDSSGEESSLPEESSDTASYWMPRGLARRRRPVLPSLRVSRMTPP